MKSLSDAVDLELDHSIECSVGYQVWRAVTLYVTSVVYIYSRASIRMAVSPSAANSIDEFVYEKFK